MQVIAVIDDEVAFCEVVMSALETSDRTVRCVGSASLGVDMLRRDHFDLALIDVVLPDGSGIALAEVALSENIPILFITGDLAAVDGLEMLGLPVLAKPFSLAQLDIETAEVMAHSRANLRRARDGISRLRGRTDASGNKRGWWR
jgi:two-component system copper resistance phosphate regulon response regulator CusR